MSQPPEMFERILGGSHGMLVRSLRGTEWQQLLDYLSPSFLDVMPIGQLLRQVREIAANATDGARFGELRAGANADFAARGLGVRVLAPGDEAEDAQPPAGLPEDARRALGQRALEIYFAQLFASDQAILDLRAARFAQAPAGPSQWFPRPLYVRWQDDFLAGLRDLYQGFYREDDHRFERGLERLELRAAGDLLQGHFGEGEQRSVRFDSRIFHSTFHEAFVRCRDEGVALHRNFLALGLYLACLYDLLEALDLAFDVRAAFDRVAPPP